MVALVAAMRRMICVLNSKLRELRETAERTQLSAKENTETLCA